MFFLKKIGCRLFQLAFRAALPLLPYREPRRLASCEEIPEALGERGCKSALIVTTTGSVRRGLIAPVEEALCRANIKHEVFDKVQPDPTVSNVEEALAAYRAGGCDCLIAIGGGSVIDCAKGVGARAAYPKRPLGKLAGVMRVMRPLPPLIAVPTTAGTGSETTLAAVILDERTRHKYAVMSFPLIPHYAVLDPRLTRTLPPHLTATTGMDALTHAVEAYIGRSTTKKTRRLALDATSLIFKYLGRAYQNGEDMEAREGMLRASYLAGVAFSMSYVGYVHALAHALGGAYGVPHGLANAVLLPRVLARYGKSAHKKLSRLAIAAGVAEEGVAPCDGAARFIEAVTALNAATGIPDTIPELREEDIPALATHAAREAHPLYPVPKLMTARELEDIYREVITTP